MACERAAAESTGRRGIELAVNLDVAVY